MQEFFILRFVVNSYVQQNLQEPVAIGEFIHSYVVNRVPPILVLSSQDGRVTPDNVTSVISEQL